MPKLIDSTFRPVPAWMARPTRLATLIAAMGLAACAAFPEREVRPEPKAVSSYATERSFGAASAEWPADDWWTRYGDAQLDALMREALADSPSIAVAVARLRRAQANAEVSQAASEPQLSANSTLQQQKQSYNYLTPRQATPQGWNDYGRATLDFSWDLDFWGKNRAALAAATSEAAALRADLAQARVMLTTSIASAYAELARLYAARDTAGAALGVRMHTAELFRQRHVNGLETLGSLRQVEARRASAEAELLSIEEQIALQRNRIAYLLGAGPDRGLSLTRPNLDLRRDIGMPQRLAAELLGRRPDIIAARLRAQSAAKRIDQAEAAFYPNVNLLAFLGVQSLGLDLLLRGGSSIGSLGAAISLPMFDGGRLRGQLRGADADYAEAVANYDATLVRALQEVADAAASKNALAGQVARTDESVDASREAWRIQNTRYEGGLATYLDVLSAEDTLLSSQRVQSDLRARAFTLDVALVRALGGGYTTIQP